MSQHDDRPDAPEPDEVQTSPSEEVDSTDGDVGAAGIDDSDEVDGPSGDPAGDVGSQGGVSRAGEGADDGFLDAPVIAESGHVDAEGDLAALGIDPEDQARRGADTDPGAPAGDPVVADPVVADPVVADSVVADSVVADPVVADPVVADSVVADPVVGDPATAGPGPGLPVGHGRGDHPEPSGSPSRAAGVVVGMVLLILIALLGAVYLMSRGDDEGPADTVDGADAGASEDTGDAEDPAGLAYTVFGEEVSQGELHERLQDIVDDETLDALGQETASPQVQGRLAQAISTLITLDVLGHAAEEEGIEITDAELDAQLEEVVATGFGGDRAAFDAQLEQSGVTTDMVRVQFRTALLAEGLVADETPEIAESEVRAAYDNQFNLPTVSHILTATEEEAQAAKDRIDGGEDFAAVATDVSTDSSAERGGQLGPLTPGQFVPEFEEAALALQPGEVSDPVETQFGFHILTVEAVEEVVPFEDVADQIEQTLQQEQMGPIFTALAERLEAEADIAVDPSLGTWAGLTGGGLLPPSAATEVPAAAPPASEGE